MGWFRTQTLCEQLGHRFRDTHVVTSDSDTGGGLVFLQCCKRCGDRRTYSATFTYRPKISPPFTAPNAGIAPEGEAFTVESTRTDDAAHQTIGPTAERGE